MAKTIRKRGTAHTRCDRCEEMADCVYMSFDLSDIVWVFCKDCAWVMLTEKEDCNGAN